jgi:hypothetical protein
MARRAQSPVTHPDDVIIDYKTGHVRIDGPVLEEQKAAWEQLLAKWPERNLIQINEQIESDPKNSSLRKQKKELTTIVSSLRDDALKRRVRDALHKPPTRSADRSR